MLHKRAMSQLMEVLDLPTGSIDSVKIYGQDPVLDTPYFLGEALASALGAQAAAITEIWKIRKANTTNTVQDQQVEIDIRAAINSATGVSHIFQSGHLVKTGLENNPTFDMYQTRDGKWIFIAGIYPHLKDDLLTLLNCVSTHTSISQAILGWDSQDLEDAIADNGLVGSMLRSEKGWRESPQGTALLKLPVVEIIKIAESDPEGFGDSTSSSRTNYVS